MIKSIVFCLFLFAISLSTIGGNVVTVPLPYLEYCSEENPSSNQRQSQNANAKDSGYSSEEECENELSENEADNEENYLPEQI